MKDEQIGYVALPKAMLLRPAKPTAPRTTAVRPLGHPIRRAGVNGKRLRIKSAPSGR